MKPEGISIRKFATRPKVVFETGTFTLYVNKDDKEMAFIPALELPDYEAAKQFLKTSRCEIIREWPNSKALYFRTPWDRSSMSSRQSKLG